MSCARRSLMSRTGRWSPNCRRTCQRLPHAPRRPCATSIQRFERPRQPEHARGAFRGPSQIVSDRILMPPASLRPRAASLLGPPTLQNVMRFVRVQTKKKELMISKGECGTHMHAAWHGCVFLAYLTPPSPPPGRALSTRRHWLRYDGRAGHRPSGMSCLATFSRD